MTSAGLAMESSAVPPAGEYQHRCARVRKAMAAEGYDAIIAADPGNWMLPSGHVRYLTNFSIGSYPGVVSGTVLVLPLDGEPILIVPPMVMACLGEWARASAWPDRVLSTLHNTWPPVDQTILDVAAAIREAGLEGARVGLCGEFPRSGELAALFPNATFASTATPDARRTPRDLLERVRRVKTDWEISQLMAAERGADAAMRAFMHGVRPGKLQRAAIAEAEWAAKSSGSEDAMTIMASGLEPWVWWHVQGERRFGMGDLVSLETNARNQGYVVQLARSGVIGRPTDNQRYVLEVATEAQEAMVDALRPGGTGGDVWAAGEAVVKRRGLQAFGRFGHGMGLSMAEGFDILPGDDYVFEDNSVMVIHAAVRHPDTGSAGLIGEQYYVKDGRAAALSDSVPPRDLAPHSIELPR